MLDGTDNVSESSDISGVVLNTVGEEKGDLLGFNASVGKEVALGSLNGVGKTLLENELIIVTDLNANHQTAVGWESLELSQFDEFSQEVVLWISSLVGNNVLDHDDSVISISFLESWQELGKIEMELGNVIGHVGGDDDGFHEGVSSIHKNVWDIFEILISGSKMDDFTVSEHHFVSSQLSS